MIIMTHIITHIIHSIIFTIYHIIWYIISYSMIIYCLIIILNALYCIITMTSYKHTESVQSRVYMWLEALDVIQHIATIKHVDIVEMNATRCNNKKWTGSFIQNNLMNYHYGYKPYNRTSCNRYYTRIIIALIIIILTS